MLLSTISACCTNRALSKQFGCYAERPERFSGGLVNFLVEWKIRHDRKDEAIRKFLYSLGTKPDLEIKGRWHREDGTGGLMVVEAPSGADIESRAEQWRPLLSITVSRVLDDNEAVDAIRAGESEKQDTYGKLSPDAGTTF